MQSWHLIWSSAGRQPLAHDERVRRRMVQAIARVAGRDAALFCIVDDHIHVVLYCDAARRAVLSRSLTLAFRPLAAAPLDPPFVRPVRDRAHMNWLADTYILRQSWKHGLAGHPATWTGSCFPDLVGARLLPGLSPCIAAALPRWRLPRAHSAVFLPLEPLEPADDARLRAVGVVHLAAAAGAAMGADPALTGKGSAEVLARRATALLATGAGAPNSEVAHALGMHPVASARLQHRGVEESVLRAVRLWIALEDAAALAPAPPPQPSATAREPEGPSYEARG